MNIVALIEENNLKMLKERILNIPKRKRRNFLPGDFKIETWEHLQPFYKDLLDRELGTLKSLKKWFKDRSELESVVAEELGWRYIRMTCDTTNQEYTASFNYFVSEIEPKIAPFSDKLNRKVIDNPFLEQIKEPAYDILIREIKKDIEIFREENIPLKTELQTESQKFGKISGAMTVEVDGKEVTLQQAGVYLESTDRALRESVYRKISGRRLQDKEALDALFDKLVSLRHRLAENADFRNFRDYMFKAMGRFDYGPEDCFEFHQSVKSEVVPMLNALAEKRKDLLQVDQLRPWDKSVDPTGKPPLKPFKDTGELVSNTVECFRRLDPYLGDCIAIMKEMGHLDLESRKGKAPGGYNYPLAEIGVPFIFMNATSTLRDLITILHEGGHAVHSFLTRDLELSDFKHTPSEVAELASMSMELLSMDHWDLFFNNPDDLRRAKKQHLEQIIETLPWVATIDRFQHWLYEHPQHSVSERVAKWESIFQDFGDDVTDWRQLEESRKYLWQKQLHLFEVPFYYIEYGMAQLGAVAVWKKYRENPQEGLNGYINALKLGYTRTIPEIYQGANIKFDFSRSYIRELIRFVQDEYHSL